MTKNIYFFKKVFKRGTIITRGVQNQTNSNRNRKKPHLVQMYSDRFLTQPHGLVRFAVSILRTKPNQTKPQHRKNIN